VEGFPSKRARAPSLLQTVGRYKVSGEVPRRSMVGKILNGLRRVRCSKPYGEFLVKAKGGMFPVSRLQGGRVQV
jgi:hypothetical protein